MRCLLCGSTDLKYCRSTYKLKFGWVDMEYMKCNFCKTERVPSEMIMRNDERVRKVREQTGINR